MLEVDKFLSELPTKSVVIAFDNDNRFGLSVTFSEKDFGFGQITFSVDKKTGEARFDNEEMSLEHCGEIVKRTVGEPVVSIQDLWGEYD